MRCGTNHGPAPRPTIVYKNVIPIVFRDRADWGGAGSPLLLIDILKGASA